MADIDIADLLRLLRYEPDTGLMYWLPRTPEQFVDTPALSAEAAAASFNSSRAGKEAFTCIGGHGYREGAVLRKGVLAHRVAWALYTQQWPEHEIDHINGCRTDNRIENLRAVDRLGNCRNLAMRSDNTSGVIGVSWYEKRKCWRARITVQGVDKTIGYFQTKCEAVAARKAAEARFGFHKNHGRAA